VAHMVACPTCHCACWSRSGVVDDTSPCLSVGTSHSLRSMITQRNTRIGQSQERPVRRQVFRHQASRRRVDIRAMQKIAGKTVVVTGASQGIGLEVRRRTEFRPSSATSLTAVPHHSSCDSLSRKGTPSLQPCAACRKTVPRSSRPWPKEGTCRSRSSTWHPLSQYRCRCC
jgi:hypothetical protein